MKFNPSEFRFEKCDCGHEMPFIPEVWTQPKESGLDIEKYGIVLICHKCKHDWFYEVSVSHHVVSGQVIPATAKGKS